MLRQTNWHSGGSGASVAVWRRTVRFGSLPKAAPKGSHAFSMKRVFLRLFAVGVMAGLSLNCDNPGEPFREIKATPAEVAAFVRELLAEVERVRFVALDDAAVTGLKAEIESIADALDSRNAMQIETAVDRTATLLASIGNAESRRIDAPELGALELMLGVALKFAGE